MCLKLTIYLYMYKGLDLASAIARVFVGCNATIGGKHNEHGLKEHAGIVASGRVFLNIWRVLRSEVALKCYSLENTVFHILHKRCVSFFFISFFSDNRHC